MEKQLNKEQMVEDILKEFSIQGELVKGLGDALMQITLAGSFNERGEWQEPEWKNDVLLNIAQARQLVQKFYYSGQDYFNKDQLAEMRCKVAHEQLDNLCCNNFKKELAAMIDYALNFAKPGVNVVEMFADRILEYAKIEIEEKNREVPG